MEVAKKYQDELSRLKKSVKNAYDYWEPNYKSFNDFRKFVFDTSLTDSDKMALFTLNKPEIEFNILEAYISRLRGEFSKQEPSIIITSEDGRQVDEETLHLVENHLRHMIFDANKNGCEYQVYSDLLGGGFSAIKIWTEYANSMSFNQIIRFDRVYDPTLVGFDPLARNPDKSDGRFCFELFPKGKEEFENEYPDVDIKAIDFTRNIQGFNWSYSNNQEDILLICDFYEKKKKRKKIIQLVNDHVMTLDEYKEFLDKWNELGYIEQPPAIKGEPRWTEIETICRYRFIENKVIEYVETSYPGLPIIYIDGNSVVLRNGTNGSFIQKTRPYIYHAKGMQQLKNFAGQTLANDLENMVQHKFMIAKEALPDEQSYLDAYTNVQLANTLVFKSFKDNDPNVAIPNPIREINRIPAPPEVTSTFMSTDSLAQSILGSYDASLGINDNQLSGTAIVEGATQSNATAMPYVVGFMQGWSRVAQMVVKMFPKYYLTPRTIPIVNRDGSKDYKKINEGNVPSFNYDENALNVKVEAGVSFAIQKVRTLNIISLMSQSMPIFGEFINTKALKFVIDNLEMKGQDELKILAEQFMQEKAQQAQMQQQIAQQQMQNNPMMIKAQNERMKLELDAKQDQIENEIKVAKVTIEKQEAETNFLKVLAEMESSKSELVAAEERAHAEEMRAAVDLAIKHVDMKHAHLMDHAEFEHKKSIS